MQITSVKSIFLVFITFSAILGASGCNAGRPAGQAQTTSSDGDPKAKRFVDAFFKEKFFSQIDKERADYEKLVLELKAKGKNKENIKAAYEETRIAYNAVLDLMSADINAVRNIAAFGTFDANTRYYDDLERARSTGSHFFEVVNNEMNDGIDRSMAGIVAVALKVWPLIKEVNDRSLAYCKKRMNVRIKQSRFKSWSEIK